MGSIPAKNQVFAINSICCLFLGVLLSTQVIAEKRDDDQLGFVLVGDTGYHHDYLAPKDYYKSAKTEQQYQAYAFERWARDDRSFQAFKFPQLTYVPEIGGYVEVSGLYPVAAGMARFCEQQDCDFALMLGDNIYEKGATLGADGRDDADRFRDMFTLPFAALGQHDQDFRIYVTLGNHDWATSREGALLQVDFHEKDPKFYMDGLFYTVKPPAGKGEVEIFAVDSQLLINMEPVYRVRQDENGFETLTTDERKTKEHEVPANKTEKNMLAWLEERLRGSKAKWKFIMAHHPMWSSSGSKSTDNYRMRGTLLPLACEYADGYFAGHDHTLEITLDTCETAIEDGAPPPLVHVVSGAGAKLRPIDKEYVEAQQKQYPQRKDVWMLGMEWGFSHLSLDDEVATLKMVEVPYSGPRDMEVVYEYNFNRRSNWRQKN